MLGHRRARLDHEALAGGEGLLERSAPRARPAQGIPADGRNVLGGIVIEHEDRLREQAPGSLVEPGPHRRKGLGARVRDVMSGRPGEHALKTLGAHSRVPGLPCSQRYSDEGKDTQSRREEGYVND